MTDGERRAYGRGYNTEFGKTNWPLHKMPVPPDPVLAKVVNALKELRDAVDGFLATCEPGDLEPELGVPLDAATAALEAYAAWLVEPKGV